MMKKLILLCIIINLVIPQTFASDKLQKNNLCKKEGELRVSKKNLEICQETEGRKLWAKIKFDLSKSAQTIINSEKKMQLDQSLIKISSPIEFCRLSSEDGQYSPYAFPRRKDLLSTSGDLSGLMVFVEFLDIKGNDNPITESRKFTENFINFWARNSYGKLKINFEVHPKYIEIKRESTDYGMQKWGSGNAGPYFADGLNAASRYYDLSKFDFFVILPPREISTIAYGPAFPDFRGGDYGSPNSKQRYFGTVGGADQRNKDTSWIWLAHEIGHNFGLGHQFNYSPAPIWDLMDNVYINVAPELFGYHRFLLGWLQDSQVFCIDNYDKDEINVVIPLTPISMQKKGIKLGLINLGNNRLLAMEYRISRGFDSNMPKKYEGLLVYEVNVDLNTKTPIKVIANLSDTSFIGDKLVGTLQPGGKINISNWKIEAKYMNSEFLYVSLIKN